MKRIITLLLAVLMIVGLFAGCQQPETPVDTSAPSESTAPAVGAAEAIEYLKALYKDDGTQTLVDYDRYKIVRIDGVAFNVEWSVDVSEDLVKIVDKDDLSVTVNVNENCDKDTEYVLTAKITDAAGNTETASWKHTLPAAVDQTAIVKDAYALENGAAMPYEVTLTGKIIAVNTPYDPDYKNVTVTIAVAGIEDKPIMCYRLKGEGADLIDNGWIISVTGIIKNYNGTIEFDSGCVLNSFEEGEGVKAPEDPTQIVDEAYALEENGILPYTATLTGEIVAIDSPYSEQYGNISVLIKVEGREDKPILCYRMKGDGVDKIMPGDIITVTGNIKNYKGTIEFDTGCILKSYSKGENSFEMPDSPEGIVDLAYSLGVGEALPVQVTLTGLIVSVDDVYSERYNNITVTMVVNNDHAHPIKCYRLKGADSDKIWEWDTITVTGTLKNYNGVVEFDAGCTLDSWVDTGANPKYPTNDVETVETLYAMEENTIFHGMYSLTGRVTKIGAYSLNYGNQDITIEVPGAEGKPVICYRMTTGGIMDIAEGDWITARGNLEDYNGKKQLTSAYLTMWDPTTLAEALDEASGLANNTYLPYASSVTGTIKINTPYSDQYKNITFTVTDSEGNEVYCYRLSGYGADQLVDGDVVTVKGNLTAYNGKPQFDKNASFVCDRLLPKTLADQYEAAKNLANNDHLAIESTIVGVITKIDQAYDPSYKNVSFTVTNTDGISIYCYRLKGNDAANLEKNDTVQVVGYLTAYNGTPQFDSTATMTLLAKGEPDVVPENVIIFDDTAKRTTVNDDQQVWEQNGIVFTNDKAGSSSVINPNYYNPVRCYKGSTFTVAYTGIENLVITCNSASYAQVLLESLPEGTVAGISDNVVTIVFDTPVDSFTTSGMTAQTRVDSITVNDPNAKVEAPVEPEIPATLAEQIEAAKALGSGSLPYDSTITGTVVITGAYDASYKNVSFNVTNTDGITLFCKYTSGEGMDTLADGDTVTVTGKLECYNGNAQFYKATAVVVKKAEGGSTETPDPDPDPGEGNNPVNLVSGEYLLSAVYEGTTYYAGAFDGSKGFTVVTDQALAVTYTITVNNDAGTATISDGTAFYGHTSGNSLSQGAFTWNVVENADGTYGFCFTHASDGVRYMAFNSNSGNPLWRSYKESSLTGSYASNYVYGFALVTPGGSTETPDPDPDEGETTGKLVTGTYYISTVYDGTTYYAGAFDGNKGFTVVTNKADAMAYTVTVNASGTATISSGSNFYGHTSGNALAQITSAFDWTVTDNGDGTYGFSFTHASDGVRYMAYNKNNGSPLWRTYKQGSLNSNYSYAFNLEAAN